MAHVGQSPIGQAVAVRAKAFGMTGTGVARSTDRSVQGFDALVASDQLATALPEADIVVCALPYIPPTHTHHLIDSTALAAMKPSALLVNAARGGIVDTSALVDALRSGKIGGAVLDVFEEEPLPADSPLWALDNVLMTPHVSGTTDLYLGRMLGRFWGVGVVVARCSWALGFVEGRALRCLGGEGLFCGSSPNFEESVVDFRQK